MILLDTHVLVWFAVGDRRLGARTRRRIQRSLREGTASVSALSFWEVALLAQAKRLQLDDTPEGFRDEVRAVGFREISIDGAIALTAARLTGVHADPADRIILATALEQKSALVTADQKLLSLDIGSALVDAQD